MAQRVKDLALSLWWLRFNLWPGRFLMRQAQTEKGKNPRS